MNNEKLPDAIIPEKEDHDGPQLGSFYVGRMRPPPEPKRVIPRGVLTSVVVIIFAGVLWYAYPRGAEKYDVKDIPVVKADTQAYKSAPENPGGMEVRHQDSTVFETLDGKPQNADEKVLPQEETPLDKNVVLGLGQGAQMNLDQKLPEQKPAEPTIVKPESPVAVVELSKPKEEPVVVPLQPEKPKAEEKPEPVQQKEEPKKEAAKPLPVTETKKPAGIYVQLGSFRDTDGAKDQWNKVKKTKPASMDGLKMYTDRADLGAKGVFYRLQTGPFVNRDKASAFCAHVKAAGQSCFVVK